MRRAAAAFFAGCLAVAIVAGWSGPAPCRSGPEVREAVELRRIFAEANERYRDGDYEDAIGQYLTLIDAGVIDKTLYYNLGNAYYKANRLGEAVVAYERALRLSPRDRDVRENLALVRTQLRDKQFVQERNRLAGLLVWLHDNLSTGEMILYASMSYLILCLLGIVFIFRESNFVSTLYRRLSILSPGRLFGLSMSQDLMVVLGLFFLLFVTASTSGVTKLMIEKERQRAIVVAEEIPVFGSPTDDATLQFKIHEGTTVKIREERRGWARIQLPGKLSGWIESGAVRRI